MPRIVSPIIDYFLSNNLCRDYTAIEGQRSVLVLLNFQNTGNYQQSYYFASQSDLDGDNCTITAIEVVNSTELTTLPNGLLPLDSSQLVYGVLYISNDNRDVIAQLPLYSLVRTNNNGKPTWVYFNNQKWQNCYVEFTTSSFTTTSTPLALRVYYVDKIKN